MQVFPKLALAVLVSPLGLVVALVGLVVWCVVNLGAFVKPHFRWATVIHVANGVVGFSMSVWTAADDRTEREFTWLK